MLTGAMDNHLFLFQINLHPFQNLDLILKLNKYINFEYFHGSLKSNNLALQQLKIFTCKIYHLEIEVQI